MLGQPSDHMSAWGAMLSGVSFFFFQAEDGIRDYKVTGVQTCALPISVAALLIVTVAIAGIVIWLEGHASRRTTMMRVLYADGHRGAGTQTPIQLSTEIGRASCRERV